MNIQNNPLLDYEVSFIEHNNDLYLIKNQDAYIINSITKEICLLCDGNHSTNDIVKIILDTYKIDESTAISDVSEILRFLRDNELLLNI